MCQDHRYMRYLREDDHPPYAIDSLKSFIYFWNTDAEFEEKMNSVMNLNVRKIGSKKPIKISTNASLEDVCNLLSKADVKTVPVVDGGKVVGTISRSAITHYLARHYLEHMEKSVTV